MELTVIGDVHGMFHLLDGILNTTKSDLYLQVGDFGASMGIPKLDYPAFKKKIIFISGNHESLEYLEKFNRDFSQDIYRLNENLYYLPTGRYAIINGLKIGALGGNYAKTRYDKSRVELSQGRLRHYTREDVDRLIKSTDTLDILLTHEASSPYIIRNRDVGRPEINRIINKLQPKYHFYGHHHRENKKLIGKTLSQCVPIINGFNPYITIKI